jgi:sensor histidine kinase regulating citrate/malate metabolism
VSDTGSAIDARVERRLFREPIERDGGLGIGLYHAARQAQQAGYCVELARNVTGDVCFALSGDASAP